VGAVIGALESGGAVDASEDGAVAPAFVRVELRLLDDVVARFAVNCLFSRLQSVSNNGAIRTIEGRCIQETISVRARDGAWSRGGD
jgi:hypothetical protein